MTRTAVLSWDWKEQPNLTALAGLVAEVSGGRVHITQVDTGDDQYAIVISSRRLDATAAHTVYDEWARAGDG